MDKVIQMSDLIIYLLIGFFLNRFYNLVKRELWTAWKRRRLRPRYLNISFPKGVYKLHPNCRCTSIDKEIDRLVKEKEQENWLEGVTLEGLSLPEGAEDFDLKGFMIDPYTGEVTGNWTQ